MVRLIASYEESLEDVRLTQTLIAQSRTVFSFGQAGVRYGPAKRSPSPAANEPDEPTAKRPRQSYDCEVCGTSYTEKRSLARHNRTPAHCEKTGKTIPHYVCSWAGCGQTFARNDVRIRHENEQHLGVKSSNRYIMPLAPASHVRQALALIANPSTPAESEFSLSNDQNASTEPADTVWLPAEDMDLDHVVSSETASTFTKDEYDTSNKSIESDTSPSSVSLCTPSSSHDMGEDADRDSIVSVQTSSYSKRSFELPIRTRSALLRAGASLRPHKTKPPPLCPLCKDPWPKVFSELRNHLQSHTSDLKGEHLCKDCDIGFVHREDLDRHLQSAAMQDHCGFPFEHQFECTGHHPKDEFDDILSDHERVMLCTQLRHWEQSQLRAFMNHLDGMVQIDDDGDYWSIGALRSCTTSVTSLGSYAAGYSAPDEAGYQTTFRRNTSLSPRQAFKRMTSRVKASKARVDDVTATTDQRNKIDLVVAAYDGNFDKVNELLLAGVDSNTSFDTARIPREAYKDPAVKIAWRYMSADISRLTPLHAAALGGHMAVIATLLHNGALITEECATRSAILYALSGKTPEFASLLNLANFTLTFLVPTSSSPGPSELSVIVDWVAVLERALEIGRQRDIDVCLNSVTHLPEAQACLTYGLAVAVAHGKVGITKLLLTNGRISLSAGHCGELVYVAGGCPLCIAKERGCGSIVAALIRSGQDVGCSSYTWRCPKWETVTMTERDLWSAEDWENC